MRVPFDKQAVITTKDPNELSPLQKAVVDAWLDPQSPGFANKRQAYLAGGGTPNDDMKVVDMCAYQIFDLPKVQLYIEQMMKESAERVLVSRDSLTVELEEARQYAMSLKQCAPAVSATMGKAKLHGLDVNKHEHTGNLTVQIVKYGSDKAAQPVEPASGSIAIVDLPGAGRQARD